MSSQTQNPYLIVGLGNPGEKYARTRHNLGFLTVSKLAERLNIAFRRKWTLKGALAEGNYGGKKVLLFKPLTYMNLSGPAVKKCLLYYKVPLTQLIVVVDEVYLKFLTMRLKPEGSAGGHNGLKSVQNALETQNYGRLRLGIGNDLSGQALEEYVLEDFTPKEQEQLPLFIEKAVSVLEVWLSQGIVAAMQHAGNLSKELNQL